MKAQSTLRALLSQATVEARPPILAFNAGVISTQSYEEDLRSLPQRTLVLSGDSDKRVVNRQQYSTEMRACTLRTLPGANVLPWESPHETCASVSSFCEEISLATHHDAE